jgi:hypothetical protein
MDTLNLLKKLSMTTAGAALVFIGTVGIAQAATINITVPGTSTPFLAGMPDGSVSSWGTDIAPTNSPVLVGLPVVGGNTFTFTTTGGTSNGPAYPLVGPEGDNSWILSHWSENGISNIIAPIDALLGVFLNDDQPNLSSPPGQLDFTTSSSRDFASLNPLLKQVFFIGDGLTSSNILQEFIAPTGSTRLFLGTHDGYGWYNNPGSLNVTVKSSEQSSTFSLLGLSVLGLVGMLKRKLQGQSHSQSIRSVA